MKYCSQPRTFFVVAIGFLLLSLLGARLAWGQVTAAISGRVEDPSGASIAGATVTVISKETSAARAVTTDDTGNYRILALPVGVYDLRAEKIGFKAEVQTGINLVVGEDAVLTVRMQIGALQDQV